MMKTGATSSFYARSLVPIVVATIFLLFQQTCAAKQNDQPCPPSSCGKIRNITSPFRLKGDPSHCGDARHELDCENNSTVLTLFSGKYHVQDIDYKLYEIRLSDAGVVEDSSCSFIPRYLLYHRNFTYKYIYSGSGNYLMDLDSLSRNTPIIAYFNCTNPITDDPRYVDVDTSSCGLGGHIYAVLQDSSNGFSVKDIKVGCHLMVATLASWRTGQDHNKKNVSYDDIHSMLVYGFSLPWLYVICQDQCGKGTDCRVMDESTGDVQCGDCRFIDDALPKVVVECRTRNSDSGLVKIIDVIRGKIPSI